MKQQIQDLVSGMTTLATAVRSLETQSSAEAKTIADLKAKIDAGGTLTPEETQALADSAATVQSLIAEVTAATAAVQPAADAAAAVAGPPSTVAQPQPEQASQDEHLGDGSSSGTDGNDGSEQKTDGTGSQV